MKQSYISQTGHIGLKLFRRTIKPLLLSSIFTGATLISIAQTSTQYGLEDSVVGTWGAVSGTTEIAAIENTAANVRTGSHSLKLTTTSTGTGNKQWFSYSPYAASGSGIYIYYIYWAKATTTGTSVDASFRYTTNNPPSGSTSSSNASNDVAITTTGWTRVTNSVNTSSIRYYIPGPRKTVSTGATSFFMDDGVIYSSSMSTVDTVDPGAASTVGGTVSGNLVTLGWTSNTDANTGVAATIILRNTNTSAAAPVLNDQGQYSAAGGSTGPNTVSGGWTVVSATVGATATSFLDVTAPTGNCIYAVVLRDQAFNYSTAAISSVINVGLPVPTIITTQAGFTGNFGTVVRGSSSAVQQYSLLGLNLSGNVTVTAPAGFEVSTSATSGFASSLTLTQTSGTVASTNIYVRYSPTAATGSTGNVTITNTSTGAASQTVTVSGNAIDVEPTSTGSISFGNVSGNSIEVNLPTVGNGAKRIIVISRDNDVTFIPSDGAPIAGVNSNYQLATAQSGNEKVIYDGSGSGNSVVTVTGLAFSTNYYFAVYEYNMGTGTSQNYLPSSPYTALARTAAFNLGIGTSSVSARGARVHIYPNPVYNTVYIDAPTPVNIVIRDFTGHTVYSGTHTAQADLSTLSQGIYTISISDDNGIILKNDKIVKLR